jgi:type IV pilus assembly protein PilA
MIANKLHRGFTLIELMIVVAIIAILAAIAIPQYKAYSIRSKVSEALSDVGPIENAFTGNLGENSVRALAVTAAEAIASGVVSKYVTGITIGNDGNITATLNNANIGLATPVDPTIVLIPAINGDTVPATINPGSAPVDWGCVSASNATAVKYLGATAVGATLGTLPAEYAPSQCQ